MKQFLPIPLVLLAGCTTSPTTGSRRLLGLVKIPFTANPDRIIVQDDKLLVLVEQLEKFTWVGIILVIAGAVWWKVTSGFTGLGKLLFGIGWAFIALGLLLPQMVAYLVFITAIVLTLAVGYVIYYKVMELRKSK